MFQKEAQHKICDKYFYAENLKEKLHKTTVEKNGFLLPNSRERTKHKTKMSTTLNDHNI